jgi:glucans biosynthesis protein
MFFYGENQLRPPTDFRPEVHDSDGLLINNGGGEWIWRPLRNPAVLAVSAFVDNNPRGFGLLQRDRIFEHYQDLELNYEKRPSYWIEPIGQWGEGHVELVEIPTPDETNDNIVAYWVPRVELRSGEPFTWRYRLLSIMSVSDRISAHPGGRVLNTYHKRLMPHEAPEFREPSVRRFLIDFEGGDLGYWLKNPEAVSVVPSASNGQILRSFVTPNPQIDGFRAVFDFRAQAGQTADLRAFLRAGQRTLTETWTYPWRFES